MGEYKYLIFVSFTTTIIYDIKMFLYFDRKLRNVLTARILKFLNERSTKQSEDYNEFYKAYGLFLKEGIITSIDQSEKVINYIQRRYL